jgi:hypothetical protein
MVETWYPVDLSSIAAALPLEYLGVPITYMSINDFINLVVQLRTVPELLSLTLKPAGGSAFNHSSLPCVPPA